MGDERAEQYPGGGGDEGREGGPLETAGLLPYGEERGGAGPVEDREDAGADGGAAVRVTGPEEAAG